MDIYAERLFGELQKMPLDARLFRPSSRVERYADSRFVMRYLRYLDYPRQVRQYCATDVDVEDVVHVLDHGYAHLLGSVQSNSRSSSLSSKVEIIYQPNSLILLVSAAL